MALLSGLHGHWGFYLTAADGPDAVGSKDLAWVIRNMPNQSSWIGDVFRNTADNRDIRTRSQKNEVTASKEMAKVLFARYAIFQLFIEEVRTKYDRLPEHTKADWTLYQIAPALRGDEDVFLSFIRNCLTGVDEKLLNMLGWPSPWGILGEDLSNEQFYFVLDEVQVAGDAHMGCFSDAEGKRRRPVLRPFVERLTVEGTHPIIVSGTGISLEDIKTVLGSGVGKSFEWRVHHEMDDLSERSRQEEYIRRYLPEEFLETKSGQLFLNRMWELFRGRSVSRMSRSTC